MVDRTTKRTRNARGEGGQLRSELVEAAREILAETGDFEKLSLRGVARRVGIAATSVYLHFTDTEELAIAALEGTYADLSAKAQAGADAFDDPGQQLLARCRAYCRFAVENPGHYHVMFDVALLPRLAADPENTPGRRAFGHLVKAIEDAQAAGVCASSDDAFRLASMVWATDHGLASLRICRPTFPWSDLDELVDETVSRIVGLLRTGSP